MREILPIDTDQAHQVKGVISLEHHNASLQKCYEIKKNKNKTRE